MTSMVPGDRVVPHPHTAPVLDVARRLDEVRDRAGSARRHLRLAELFPVTAR
ncbi:hypothetical protein [Micromonospora sp. NPDC023956]|uniref:hypothetical protein n=1 Tax=Micromonospora sp. NPDC023956 TaxID=3155722 RepID=UPI0033C8FD65